MFDPTTVTRHVARVRLMAASSPTVACYYLATLRASAVAEAARLRANFADDWGRRHGAERADEAAETYKLATVGMFDDACDAFTSPRFAVSEAERAVAPIPLTEPRFYHGDGPTGPYVWVGADDRTDQRPSRGWWLELQVGMGLGGDQRQLSRRVETREEAVTVAGRWAALGMAILAADDALRARGEV